MLLVVCHAERLALAVGIHKRDREHVLLRVDAAVVAQCEGPVQRGMLDGPPEVDYLEAVREKLRYVLGGEMAVHARDGRRGRLVDVDLRDGLALVGRVLLFAWRAAADSCKKSSSFKMSAEGGETDCGRR